VADVNAFSEWLLAGTPGPNVPWSQTEIEGAIAAGGRLDVKLTSAVPVAWVYMTGYATPNATVHFRDDIYGLDERGPAESPTPGDVAVTSSIARGRL
jgi:murein L,D-transpeptidase YcbB/YkuD